MANYNSPWNKGNRNRIKKICLICNKVFYVIPSRDLTAKYCSRSCLGQTKIGKNNGMYGKNGKKNPNWKGKIKKTCLICGKDFFVSPSIVKNRKTCSLNCKHILNGQKTLERMRSEEARRKIRLSCLKYLEEVHGKISPRIGRNEKVILDSIENQLGYKILRQYPINGYFLDGYISLLNLAIEIDERPKTNQRDINREKEIKKYLDCEMLRIENY